MARPQSNLSALRRSYRKLRVTADPSLRDGLFLHLSGTTTIEPADLVAAVHKFAHNPTLSTVSLTPILSAPRSTWQLLKLYTTIAQIPFDTLRAEYGTTPKGAYLSRQVDPSRNITYAALSYLIKIINTVLLFYSCYAALILGQPILILMYALLLQFWLLWSIGRYKYFSFHQKVIYIVLSPASFVGFIVAAFVTPLKEYRKIILVRFAPTRF